MCSQDMPGGCLAHAADWPAFVQLAVLAIAVLLAVHGFSLDKKELSIRGRTWLKAGKDQLPFDTASGSRR